MAKNPHISKKEAESFSKKLLQRDEYDCDKNPFGQNVQKAFEKADYYIGSDENGLLAEELERFVHLVFQKPFISPTIQEIAMAHAYMAGLRSIDLSRQVGSAIVSRDGRILTTGCNEVPKPGGGQYRTGDFNDARDSKIGFDSNDKYKTKAILQIIKQSHASRSIYEDTSNKTQKNYLKQLAALDLEDEDACYKFYNQ